MIKKGKIIKRVYVKGRETTVSSGQRQAYVKKQPMKVSPAPVIAPRPVIIDNYELPPHYDNSRITLMVKDPFWIFAYWDIAPSSVESLKNRFGQQQIEHSKIVLRMYDITMVDFNGANANYYFDIEVSPHTNNWYINFWRDNISFAGEIGFRLPDGRFIPLARSNYVNTPRSGYSPRGEQIWMKVTDEGYAPPYIIPTPKISRPDEKHLPSYTPQRKGKKPIYLTEDEIRRYYARISPLLRDVISMRLGRLYDTKGRYAFLLEGESVQERRRLLARFPHLRKIMLGASEELLLGASEQLGGASEFMHARRKFFFQLDTELIVYGRTEPDAELWLGDKKIPLNKDGTFNLRFALADGKIPLEFKAISADKKEIRNINTYIERSTNYY